MARPRNPDSPPPTPLGLELRKARRRSKLTQQEAAEAIGVRQASVSGWERGSDMPRGDRLTKIARAYAMPEGRLRSLWMKQLGSEAA